MNGIVTLFYGENNELVMLKFSKRSLCNLVKIKFNLAVYIVSAYRFMPLTESGVHY